MRTLLLIGILALLGSAPASAAEVVSVANSRAWLKLLHLGRIRDARFYLSPRGKNDPVAELQADLAEAQEPESLFACRFPARFRFLSAAFGGLKRPAAGCRELDHWIAQFEAESVSVVFSSPYFSNPSSALGHTFLRFHGAQRSRLLDLTIGYAAAIPDDTGAVSYVYNGLSGGFAGRYFLAPYYGKIQEYSVIENRDLWEYRLDFTREETLKVLEHAWELSGTTREPYYFLDENCSLVLLELLNAVRPEAELDTGLYLYVLPIQSVKALARAGWIKGYEFRPSVRRTLLARVGALSPAERDDFDRLRSEPAPAGGKLAASPAVLETLIDYYRFTKIREGNHLSREDEARLRATLLARAALGDAATAPRPAVVEPPPAERGPDPHHLSLGGGYSSLGAFTELTLYPGVHEPLDPDNAYIRYSEVSVLSATARAYVDRGLFVPESIELLKLANFVSYSGVDRLPSWRASLGLFSREREGCAQCLAGRAELGYGLGRDLVDRVLYGYALAAGTVENGLHASPGVRLEAGPELGLLATASSRLRLRSAVVSQWAVAPAQHPFRRFSADLDAAWMLSSAWQLTAGLQWSDVENQSSVTVWEEGRLLARWFF